MPTPPKRMRRIQPKNDMIAMQYTTKEAYTFMVVDVSGWVKHRVTAVWDILLELLERLFAS